MKRIFILLLVFAMCLPCALAEKTAPEEIVIGNITFALPENGEILMEAESDGRYEMSGSLGEALHVFALMQWSIDAETVENLRTTQGEKVMLEVFAAEHFAAFNVLEFEPAYPSAKENILCVTGSVDFSYMDVVPSGLSQALFLDGTQLTVLFVIDMNGTAEDSAQMLEKMIAPMMIEQ